jgi:hypothetical protein
MQAAVDLRPRQRGLLGRDRGYREDDNGQTADPHGAKKHLSFLQIKRE